MKRIIPLTVLFVATVLFIGLVAGRPKKVLLVGDSWAEYCPPELFECPIDKIAKRGAHRPEIDLLIWLAPDEQYDRIFLIFGMAESFDGIASAEIAEHQCMLAEKIESKYGVVPVIVSLEDMHHILKDPQNRRDAGHINDVGYEILTDLYHFTNPQPQ